MFSSRVYSARRQALQSAVGSGILLFLGNDDSPINYADNVYAFRQDSSFLYYFGLDLPGLSAVIDVEQDRVTLYGDEPPPEAVIWAGTRPTLEEMALAAGIGRTAPQAELQAALKNASGSGRPIHFLPPYRPQHILRLCHMLALTPEALSGRSSAPLVHAVVAQRSVKDDEEIEQIEAALAVTHRMHTLAMGMCRPGVSERAVAAAMTGLAYAEGSPGLAYPTIFTTRGEVLHNPFHENVMAAGDLIINDSGAESGLHYASDVTRTIPVGGRFSTMQRDIYRIVLSAQEAAMGALAPGVVFKEVHLLAARELTAGLKTVGVMKGDVSEAVHQGAHALFFPCGLGHMMGLDVHDMESLGEDAVGYTDTIRRAPQFGLDRLRLGKALEAGFVVTVEPGIYFIPPLIDRWRAEGKFVDFIDYDAVDRYRNFGGVRVEDDVLITEAGSRILGPPLDRAPDAIEALTGSG